MMNENTYFPWLESLKTRFFCSFPEVDSDAFSVLHNNIHEEYVNLLKSPKKSKLKAFYALLRDFYFHICWKINWKKEHHLYSNCVGFLFYLSHVALILSKGNVYSTWFNHILMIFKSFQGDPFLVCDVLLLMKNVKKKYHKAYSEILKSVLYDVNMKEPPDVECFIKVILLFRRLKLLTVTETSCSEIAIFTSEIKPPPGVKNWLSSLGAEEFNNIKEKKIAKNLLKNEFQRKYIEKLLHVLLADKYDEKLTNFKVCKVSENQECVSKPKPKKKKPVKITAEKEKKANNHPCRLQDENSAVECETYVSQQKIIVASHNALEESSEANHNEFPTGTKEERSTFQNIQYPLVLNSECKLELEVPVSKTSNSQKKKSKKRSYSQTVNSTEPSPEDSSTNHHKKKKRIISDTINSKKETDSDNFSIQTDETQNLNNCQRSMVNDKTIVTSPEQGNSTSGKDQIVPQNLPTNCSSPSKDSPRNHLKKSKVFSYSNNVDNSENCISSSKLGLSPIKCTKAVADGSFKIFHPDHQRSCEIQTNDVNEAFSVVPCSDNSFSNNKSCNREGPISLCNQNQKTSSKSNQSTPLVNNKDNFKEFCPNICFEKTDSYSKSSESRSIKNKNLNKSYTSSDKLVNETRGVSTGFDDSNIYISCERTEAEECVLQSSETCKKGGIKKAVDTFNCKSPFKKQIISAENEIISHNDVNDSCIGCKYSSAQSNNSLKDLETSTCKNSGNQNSPISLHNDCPVKDQIITNETIESDKPNILIHDCDSEIQNSTLENSKAYINGNAPTENHGAVEGSDACSKELFEEATSTACVINQTSPKSVENGMKAADLFISPFKPQDMEISLSSSESLDLSVSRVSSIPTNNLELSRSIYTTSDSATHATKINGSENPRKKRRQVRSKKYISSSDSSSSESDVLKCKGNAPVNPPKKRRRARSKKYISSTDSSSCESDVLKCKEVKAVNNSDGQTSLNKLLVKSRNHDDKSDISSSESNAPSETEVCDKGEMVQSKEYIENSYNSGLESSIVKSKEKSVTHESSLPLEQTAKLPNNVTTSDICKSSTANIQGQHSQQPVILKNLQVVMQDYFDSPNCVNSRVESSAQNTVPSNKNTDDNIVHSDQKLTPVRKQKGKKLKSCKISENKSISTNNSNSKHKLNDSLNSRKSSSHSKLSGESASENTRDSDHETNPSDESSTFGERKRSEFISYSASEDNSFHSASTSSETDLNDFINDSTDENSSDKDSDSLFKTSSPVVNSKNLVLVPESEDSSNNSDFSLSHPPKRIIAAKKKFKSYLLASETDDDDNNDLKTDQTKKEKNFISGNLSGNPLHKATLEDKVAPDSKLKKEINSKQSKKEAGEVKFGTFDAKSDTDLLNEVSVCSNSNEVTSSVVQLTDKNNYKSTCKNPNKELKLDQNSPEESTEELSKSTETSNHIQNEFSELKKRDNSKEILCSSENQSLSKYPEVSNNTRSKTSISKKRVNAKEDAVGSENQSCSSDPEMSNNIQNKSSRSKKQVNAGKITSPEVSNRIQNKSSISNKRVNAKEIACSSKNQTCSKNPEISNNIRNKSSRSKRSVNATEISSSGISNSIQNKPTRSNKKVSAKEIPCSSENQCCSKNLEISHTIESKSSRSKRSINAKEIACFSENQSSIVNQDSNLRTKTYNLRNSSLSKGAMKISSNNQSCSANNSKRSTLKNRQNPSLEIPSSASVSVLSNKNSHLNESSSKEVECESDLSSNVNAKHYSLRKRHDYNKSESTPTLKSDSLYDIPLSELQKRIKNTLNSSLHADLVNINQLCFSDSSNNIRECGGNLNPLDVNQHKDVIFNNNLDHSVESNLKECTVENAVHNGNLLCTNLEPSKSKHEKNLHRQNSVTSKTQPIRDVNKSMGHSVSADKSVNKDPLLDSNCLFDENFFLACLDKIDSNILANPEYLNSCIDDYLNSTSESAIINDVGKNPNLNNFHFNSTVPDDNAVSSSNHQITEYFPHLVNTSNVQCHDDSENSRTNPTVATNSVVIQNRETKSDQNSSLEKSDSDQLSTHLFFSGNNSRNSGKIGCEISLRINTNITQNSNLQKDTSINSDNVLISCSDQDSKVCAQFQVNNKPFEPTLSEMDFKTSISDKLSSTLNSESLMVTEQPHESLAPVNLNQSTLNVSGLDTILNTETNSNKNTNDKQVSGEKILFICDVGEKICEGYLMPPNSSVTITNKNANVSCVTSSHEDTCSSSTDCNCSVCKDPSSIEYGYHNDENSENVSKSNTNTPRRNVCKNRMKRPTSFIPVINLGARCDQEEFGQNNLDDSTSTLFNESLMKESISSPTSNICDVGEKICEGYLTPPNSSVTITNKNENVSCVTSSHEGACSSSTDYNSSACKDPSSIVYGYHNDENSENVSKLKTNTPMRNACKNRMKRPASSIPVINLGTRCDQEEFGQNNLNDSRSTLSNESLRKENNNQGNSFLKSNPRINGSENSNKKNISRKRKSVCDEKDNCTVTDERKKGYNLRSRSRLRK